MNIFSLLLFFACINYLYLGISAYRLDRDARVNRIFLMICLAFALWAFSFSLMNGTTDRHAAFHWYAVSVIGWILFLPLSLHLFLLLSRRDRLINAATLALMYLPAAGGIVYAEMWMLHPGVLRAVPGGWVPVFDIGSPPLYIFMVSCFLYLGAGFISLYLWGRRSRFRREKKQMKVILGVSIVSMLLSYIFDNILPGLNMAVIPLTAPLMGMIWVAGTWYAIKKYRFMTLDTSFAAGEIIDSMRDLLVMIDYSGLISHVSIHTCETLGYRESELIGMSMNKLVAENDFLEKEWALFADCSADSGVMEIHFRTSAGDSIPVLLSGSALRDGEGDLLGLVFVGHDLRETRMLREMQRMVDIDMEMAAHVQSGIFPARLPETDEWEIFLLFRPVSPVSGDFYDFYVTGGKLRGVSLFDVSGHGVAAGLITMIAKSIVSRAFMENDGDPLNSVMERINAELVKEIGHLDNFITGSIIRFHDGGVEYVNAAHTHLLVRRASDGSVSPITLPGSEFRGPFLGVPDIMSGFRTITFGVSPGDRLLLYSDALVESSNVMKLQYGLERLVDSFGKAPTDALDETVEYIMQDLKQFTGEQAVRDDLTIILLKRNT
jgi:PAS domain S-box-containing protein